MECLLKSTCLLQGFFVTTCVSSVAWDYSAFKSFKANRLNCSLSCLNWALMCLAPNCSWVWVSQQRTRKFGRNFHSGVKNSSLWWSVFSLVRRSFWRLPGPEETSLKGWGCCVPMSCWYWYRRWKKSLISSTVTSCLPATLRSIFMATVSLPNKNPMSYSLAFESIACFAVFSRCLRKSEKDSSWGSCLS